MGDAVTGGDDGGDSRPRFACDANDANDDESLAAKEKKTKNKQKGKQRIKSVALSYIRKTQCG